MNIEDDNVIAMKDGEPIVIPKIKACGQRYGNNKYYIGSGITEAHRLWSFYSLENDSKLLDIGCGKGRLATGLILTKAQNPYIGIDVDSSAISWCQRYITPQHPNFQFIHLDVKHAQYNPEGSLLKEGFQFPFSDDEFDILYLWSVMNHMVDKDIRSYLKEFRRILKPNGRIFVSICFDRGIQTWRLMFEGNPPVMNTFFNPYYFEHLLFENGLYSHYVSSPLLSYDALIHPKELSELQIRRADSRIMKDTPENWAKRTEESIATLAEGFKSCEELNKTFLKEINK